MLLKLKLISVKRILKVSLIPLLLSLYMIPNFTIPAYHILVGPEDYNKLSKNQLKNAYVDLNVDGTLLKLDVRVQEADRKVYHYFLYNSKENNINIILKIGDSAFRSSSSYLQDVLANGIAQYGSDSELEFQGLVLEMNKKKKTFFKEAIIDNKYFNELNNDSMPIYMFAQSNHPYGNERGVLFIGTISLLLTVIPMVFSFLSICGLYNQTIKKQIRLYGSSFAEASSEYKNAVAFHGDIKIGNRFSYLFQKATCLCIANADICIVTFDESKKQLRKDIKIYDVIIYDKTNRKYRVKGKDTAKIANYYTEKFSHMKVEPIWNEQEEL